MRKQFIIDMNRKTKIQCSNLYLTRYSTTLQVDRHFACQPIFHSSSIQILL